MVLHINKKYFRGIQLAESQLTCCQLADDTTIFLKSEKEVKKTIDCLDAFSLVSGLKVNIKKREFFALKDRPNKKYEVFVLKCVLYHIWALRYARIKTKGLT